MIFIRKILYDIGLALYFLIYYRFKYFKFLKEYFIIKKNQTKSIEYNISLQKERLYNIVNFAIKNVQYYKRISEQKSITISKNTIFEDIKKFPILTKEIIRNNWNALHPDLKNKRLFMITSGGTTGEPIKIMHDEDFIVKSSAAIKSFFEIGDYFSGDRLLRVWGDERLILNESIGRFNHFKNIFIKNTFFQNTFRMSDSIITKYIKELNLIKPKIIYAYVQSIEAIAKFIKEYNLHIVPITSIVTTSGILTDDIRNLLEDVFNCRIYNFYGSREISITGISCKKSNKIHINMYQKYIEIVDNDFQNVREHEKGEIIITNLINYSMPMIRYRIGDMGSLDYSKCPCGRGLIRFDNVYGRYIDLFKNQKGELIYGDFFTHLFYFRENVKQFQVVQEKINKINISIVTRNKNRLDESVEKDLTDKVQVVMGKDCEVNFNYVSSIDPCSSGKLRYTISKIV